MSQAKIRPPARSRAGLSISDHLERMAPSLRATIRAVRRTVLAAAPPAAKEIVYQGGQPRSASAVWKIARYRLGETEVVGIAAASAHALLYFYRGIDLDDGSGLLAGRGKAMRSIRLESPEDASRPAVVHLLGRAFAVGAREGRTRARIDHGKMLRR